MEVLVRPIRFLSVDTAEVIMSELKLLINGNLVSGERQIDVINPATEKVFVQSPVASIRQADLAIASAKEAFPLWSQTPLNERQEKLNLLADKIRSNANELATALVKEQGKPLQEAAAEVLYTEAFMRYFASHELKSELVQDDEYYQIEMHYKPLGVVVGISPWNLPLLIGLNKVGPAVVTGNTVILKPAPSTPVTTLMIGAMAQEIFPPGVINIITDKNDLGAYLTGHPDVAKVSFTGSTATGKKVAQSALSSLKRLTLELGGNDAGIVLDDVDVTAVAEKIFAGSFMNCGQVCIALKRLYVHESQYDEMCNALAGLAEQTEVGDGMRNGVKIGPLQNKMQYRKALDFMEIGRRDGNIIAGGTVPEYPGFFITPTIVRDIDDTSVLVNQEQFAPILPIIKYSNIDDVIRLANHSEYGLGGSVWSSNIERAKAVAAKIDSGTVWINHHLHFGPNIPFCGAKESGLGVEFSREGIAEFTQRSVISVAK
jgi:aldehyde dehydrogenase (NAD+)